jgi:hypothetical protein
MNTRLGSGASVVGKGKTSKRRPRKSPKQEAQDLLDAMAPFHTRKNTKMQLLTDFLETSSAKWKAEGMQNNELN